MATPMIKVKHKPILFIFTGLISCLAGLSLQSCESKNGKTDEFDRRAMLTFLADSLIITEYRRLDRAVEKMAVSADSFISRPDSVRLSRLQTDWHEAYLIWMYTHAFNFGPAGDGGIRKTLLEEAGTWPANAALIESNIAAGNTSLNDFNRDNRGFNGMDYLIHDLNGNKQTVIQSYLNDPKRGQYLKAVAGKLAMQIKQVSDAWPAYRSDFIASDGTSVGSSISLYYNEFVKSFENLKNFKVALPLGLRAGQTSTEATKVEARYSGKSLYFIRAHWKALESLWYGKTRSGYDGTGWKEYLESVTGGKNLIAATESQMALINTALNSIANDPSMEVQIASQFAVWQNLHTELQKHIRLFKSDMSSLLGIAITFSSGDGD